MDAPRFERVCRTSNSEAYLVVDGDVVVARVDLHYTTNVVYGVLVVEQDLDEQALVDLRREIDEELVQTADLARDDFLLAVYRGSPVRQEPFSDEDDLSSEADDEG
ncbi:MAG: hypothetical protein IT305_09245 [Chloroflexi bacterium]|nr:hypothetical protein [Chloroflexota bacterium]